MLLNFNNIITCDSLISEKYTGTDLFCTKTMLNATVVFDLKNIFNVSNLKIVNRIDHKNLTTRLQLFISNSDFIFKKIDIELTEYFDSYVVNLETDVRYLMFRIPGVGQLSLNSVELTLSRPSNSNFNTNWGFIDHFNVYYPLHDSGFFSMLTAILEDLININCYYNITKFPAIVSNQYIFSICRDYDYINKEKGDFYDYFEKPICSSAIEFQPDIVDDKNQIIVSSFVRYENLKFSFLNSFIDTYFKPSTEVLYLCNVLVNQLGINFNKTIGIHYRGTDKSTEIELKPLVKFFDKCDELLLQDPDCSIFCLSDQTQILNDLRLKYKHSFITLENLPTTSGDRGLHYTLKDGRKNFSINFLCSIIILSRCKYVITHTGNGALWTALFRKSTENFYQI